MNLYAYVANDPVNLVDPMGLIAWNSTTECSGGVTSVGDEIIVQPRSCKTTYNSGWSGESDLGNNASCLSRRPCNQVDAALPDEWVVVGKKVRNIIMIAKNGVTCGISSAVYAVKYSFSMAGDAIDSALDAVHDVAFPPACGGPCGSEGQARVALSNREFRRWFHQVYKQQENFGGGGRDNPDMTADEILDAYDEWNENQQKNEPDCE